MKKLHLLLTAILSMAIILTSCNKEDLTQKATTAQYYEFTSQSGETIKIDKSFGYSMEEMQKIVYYFDANCEENKEKVSLVNYTIDCGQTRSTYIRTNGNTKCYVEKNPNRNNIYESELCVMITSEGSADVCWYYKNNGDSNWYFMSSETITTSYQDHCNSRDLDYNDRIKVCITKNYSTGGNRLHFRVRSNCYN